MVKLEQTKNGAKAIWALREATDGIASRSFKAEAASQGSSHPQLRERHRMSRSGHYMITPTMPPQGNRHDATVCRRLDPRSGLHST